MPVAISSSQMELHSCLSKPYLFCANFKIWFVRLHLANNIKYINIRIWHTYIIRLLFDFITIGNKEAAFVQAITTASIMHRIARTCRDGQLTRCGCSTMARPTDLSKDWIWKGCGDNLEYGYK